MYIVQSEIDITDNVAFVVLIRIRQSRLRSNFVAYFIALSFKVTDFVYYYMGQFCIYATLFQGLNVSIISR